MRQGATFLHLAVARSHSSQDRIDLHEQSRGQAQSPPLTRLYLVVDIRRRPLWRIGFCLFYSSHGNNKVIEYPTLMQSTIHVYEVRPRKDKRGVDLISDALPFGWL
jgi:hypothetical protein